MIRTYSELVTFKTYKDRFNYLRVPNSIGKETFGFDRYLNQRFYGSSAWKSVRDKVIIRDEGCDLGLEGYEIGQRIYIHHMNPMTLEDFESGSSSMLDPENLICVSLDTHNAIHFGAEGTMPNTFIERAPGDTTPW